MESVSVTNQENFQEKLCLNKSRISVNTSTPFKNYDSIVETKTPAKTVDAFDYEGRYFSPWLSKPRKKAEKLNNKKHVSSKANNWFKGDEQTNRTPGKISSTKKDPQRLDFCTEFTLTTLKQALRCLGIEPSLNQWEMICKTMHANDLSIVNFSDFMKAVNQKEALRIELDFNGISSEQLFRAASALSDDSENNNSHSVLLSVLSEKIIQLREEKKVLAKEVEHLKLTVEQKTNLTEQLEKEIQQLHQDYQIDLNSNTQKLVAEKDVDPCEKDVGKRECDSVGIQTDGFNVQKRFSALSKRLHRSEFNYHLYKIATEKLLQFTQVVHDILSEGRHLKTPCLQSENISDGSEKKINRSSSIQTTHCKPSNYFLQRHENGGKVLRASSISSVNHLHSKNLEEHRQNDGVDRKYLDKLAAKAKHIVLSIQNILQDDKVQDSCIKITQPDSSKNCLTLNKNQFKNAVTSNMKPAIQIQENKKVIWV